MNRNRRILLAFFISTAFIVAACNKDQPVQNDNHSAMQHSQSTADAPFDLQFLDTMTVHHQAAIDMAKMVEGKAGHAEIGNLAKDILSTQTDEITKMKQWRDEWFADKPSAVNMEMSGMKDAMKETDMAKLGSLTGKEFDLEFVRQMIAHHTGAVVMANAAIENAKKNEIKTLAADIIKAQSKEIRQMQEWQKQWSK